MAPEGDRVRLDAAIEVQFNGPVNKTSVEKSLAVQPAPVGSARVSWRGDRVLRYEHDGWASGRNYEVKVGGQLSDGRELSPLSWVFRSQVPRPKQIVPGNGSNVIFTFDDGPKDFMRVERLLELLARYRVRAIFFPTAHSLKKRPDWVERIRLAGHQVCNHSYSHPDFSELSEAALRREIERGAGHGQCALLRPPGGAYNQRTQRVAKSLGYELFLWDVDSRDWENNPKSEIRNRVLRGVRPGAVVLFHTHGRHTIGALPRLIRRLHSAGYVLTWDPGDLEDPSRFRIGLEQTWVGNPATSTARWSLPSPAPASDAGPQPPSWPFTRASKVPAWARRARARRAEESLQNP